MGESRFFNRSKILRFYFKRLFTIAGVSPMEISRFVGTGRAFFFVVDCQTETFFFLSDHRQTRMLETCRCRWQILFLPSARRDFQEGIGFIGCRFNAVHDGKLIGTHWISGLYRWTPILYTALLKYRREENYCYSRAVSTPLPFALHPRPPRFISSRSSRSFFLSR